MCCDVCLLYIYIYTFIIKYVQVCVNILEDYSFNCVRLGNLHVSFFQSHYLFESLLLKLQVAMEEQSALGQLKKAIFHQMKFSLWSKFLLCFFINFTVLNTRESKFRSLQKIPPSGKLLQLEAKKNCFDIHILLSIACLWYLSRIFALMAGLLAFSLCFRWVFPRFSTFSQVLTLGFHISLWKPVVLLTNFLTTCN